MNNELKSLLLSHDPVNELRDLHSSNQLTRVEKTLTDLVMVIPKGFHHKDVFEHSLRVMQNAIDREDKKDLILRTAALFHDIGKPATREFVGKGNVTFVNHDVVGSKITRKVLPKHGLDKVEVDSVSRLVYMHMRSHTFKSGWSESAVRRLSTQAGSDKQLERLVIIFESDATTKHENKLAAIHKNVAELAAEMERVKAKDARNSLRPALDGLEVSKLLGIAPGPELGRYMRFLNSDAIVNMDHDATLAALMEFAQGGNE